MSPSVHRLRSRREHRAVDIKLAPYLLIAIRAASPPPDDRQEAKPRALFTAEERSLALAVRRELEERRGGGVPQADRATRWLTFSAA